MCEAIVQVVRSEDDADDEMLSVAVLKGGSKVVVGTGNGTLAIFSWGHWEDCSDRFPGAIWQPIDSEVRTTNVYCRTIESRVCHQAVSLVQILPYLAVR